MKRNNHTVTNESTSFIIFHIYSWARSSCRFVWDGSCWRMCDRQRGNERRNVLTWKWGKVLCVFERPVDTVLPPQGGIAFVAIKGAFKVYFKQQQYLRQAHRKILDFPEQEEAWGGAAVRREDDRTKRTPLLEGWGGGRRWTVRLWSAGETDFKISVTPINYSQTASPHLLTPSVVQWSIAPPMTFTQGFPPSPLHIVFKLSTDVWTHRSTRVVPHKHHFNGFPKNLRGKVSAIT